MPSQLAGALFVAVVFVVGTLIAHAATDLTSHGDNLIAIGSAVMFLALLSIGTAGYSGKRGLFFVGLAFMTAALVMYWWGANKEKVVEDKPWEPKAPEAPEAPEAP